MCIRDRCHSVCRCRCRCELGGVCIYGMVGKGRCVYIGRVYVSRHVCLCVCVCMCVGVGVSVSISLWVYVCISSLAGVCVCVCIYCLLYTSDAADERSSVDLGGRR